MLYLKKANLEDGDKEYEFYSLLPENETGFTNVFCGISRERFLSDVLPALIGYDRGIGLPEGYVPETSWVLWEDDEIVGLFRTRHRLTDSLRSGAGHIGYSIRKGFRGRGYASEGLRLAVEKAWEVIEEDEIYLSVHRDNPASLAVQQKNGAYIHHADEGSYYTRIPRD